MSGVVRVTAPPLLAAVLRALVEELGWKVDDAAAPIVEIVSIGCRPRTRAPRLAFDLETDPERLVGAIEDGAAGYLPASASVEEVSDAVAQVAAGHAAVPTALLGPVLRTLIDRRRDESRVEAAVAALTARERQTLAGVLHGLTAAEMADRSFVAVSTVRSHVKSLLRKLDVNSQVEAAALVRDTLPQPEIDDLLALLRPEA